MVNSPVGMIIPVPIGIPLVSDWVGIVGILLSVLGFGLTLWSVHKSRTAADQARNAVNLVTKSILKNNTVADLSSAIAKLDEIKRLHRLCGWEVLAERYYDARKVISSINQPSYFITEEQQVMLQNAIMQLSKMENSVEKAVYDKQMSNATLLKHSNILNSIVDDVIAIIVTTKSIQEEV